MLFMETKPTLKPGNFKRNVTTVILSLAAIAVIVFILIDQHESQKSRIADWATQNGYNAVEIRKAGFFEPSPFVLNNEHDDLFRAELEDASHHRRTSWFRFRLLGMEQAWGY
jgi:hypothetical protein